MTLLLLTGKRVFGAIGFVAAASALLLWGDGGAELAFSSAMKLMKWYPLITLPLFIYMGYMLSESGVANDLYRMFHFVDRLAARRVGGGTIGLMAMISAMNGLSGRRNGHRRQHRLARIVAARIRQNYGHRRHPSGQFVGILIPPSVVLVLYGMIAANRWGDCGSPGLCRG